MYPETFTTCAWSTIGGAGWPGVSSSPSTCPFESPNFCSAVSESFGGGRGVVFLISSILRSKQASRAVSAVSSAHAISASESASPLPKVGQQSSTPSSAAHLVPVFVEIAEMALPHSRIRRRNQHSAFSANRLRHAYRLIACSGLLAGSICNIARAAVPEPPDELSEIVVQAPEPRFVAPTLRDKIGRIWAPVWINGKGPFRLVLDTGANHSGVTLEVAELLGLPSISHRPSCCAESRGSRQCRPSVSTPLRSAI
jgi:hypothetical protein